LIVGHGALLVVESSNDTLVLALPAASFLRSDYGGESAAAPDGGKGVAT
jgi:hypothetical protein